MQKDNTYCLHIEIEEQQNSVEFFKDVSALLNSINDLNNAICSCLNTEMDTEVILDGVSSGSLKTFLHDNIKKIPDEAIANFIKKPKETAKDMVAHVVIKAKHLLLKKLQEEPKELPKATDEIIAEVIDEAGLKGYGYSIDKASILKSLSGISKNSKGFKMPPIIMVQDENLALVGDYTFDPLDVEGVVEEKSEYQGSFFIKKPDLAGDSKWTIIHGKNIDVKIIDNNWINKLKNHEVVFGCGDKIAGTLITHTYVDRNLKVIGTDYFLDKILGVYPPNSGEQKTIEFKNPNS
ncbi:hypothetical protein [Campylobacter sp. CCUG 57310]|uniref:hypothetical protein n=1 Tax=Campylobacter sp. CCUG 57310 TaxID=2517362 RepID=UPI0015661947|nr:hypothetical protein [Campylobacter sp. CCUG 57310]QKF92343.1 hypothetical protein CORI_1154 [Campylobacter sp. CCUG 57310]